MSKAHFGILMLAFLNIFECFCVLLYKVSQVLDDSVPAKAFIITLQLKLVDPFVKAMTFIGLIVLYIKNAVVWKHMSEEDRERTLRYKRGNRLTSRFNQQSIPITTK